MLIGPMPVEAVMFGRCKSLFALALLLAIPVAAVAQTPVPSTSPPAQAQPSQPESAQPLLKPEQLEALVAPIALYPDALTATPSVLDMMSDKLDWTKSL